MNDANFFQFRRRIRQSPIDNDLDNIIITNTRNHIPILEIPEIIRNINPPTNKNLTNKCIEAKYEKNISPGFPRPWAQPPQSPFS